jgi:S-DNA-T family DNA segregation ATPase FtsK/SpoIIIE
MNQVRGCGAGALAGMAAGQAPERRQAADPLLDDILAVTHASQAKAWNDATVDRFAELRPEVYGLRGESELADKVRQLITALKPYGVATGQVARRINGKTVTGPASSAGTSPRQ